MQNQFSWVNPRYIQLKAMFVTDSDGHTKESREIEKISTASGNLVLDYATTLDGSLVNNLMRIGQVEFSNPAPDIHGKTCPLLPGDIVFADNTIFHEVWQEVPELKNLCMKNHIVAYERDGKVYGYHKTKNVLETTRTNGVNYPPEENRVAIPLHVYAPGYRLAKHRPDVYDKYFGLGGKYSGTHITTNFNATRGLKSVFEVISEEEKGKLFILPFDHAIPYRIDQADLAAHGISSSLKHGEPFYGIEIDDLFAEVTID